MERPTALSGMPFDFVVEALETVDPIIGRMFGCFSIYVGGKIVLILRDRKDSPQDNGVWIATTAEHHSSLGAELPSMRSIEIFGPGPTGWQVIPTESDSFDQEVLHVCRLIKRGDIRVGKIPKLKRKKKPKKSVATDKTSTSKMRPVKPKPARKKLRKKVKIVRKKRIPAKQK